MKQTVGWRGVRIQKGAELQKDIRNLKREKECVGEESENLYSGQEFLGRVTSEAPSNCEFWVPKRPGS